MFSLLIHSTLKIVHKNGLRNKISEKIVAIISKYFNLQFISKKEL